MAIKEILQINQWVKKKNLKDKSKKYLEMNENKETVYQNLCNVTKALLRVKCIKCVY